MTWWTLPFSLGSSNSASNDTQDHKTPQAEKWLCCSAATIFHTSEKCQFEQLVLWMLHT